MKTLLFTLSLFISSQAFSTVHVVLVWNGYFQFWSAENSTSSITITLGDTVDWLPLDQPTMLHTITSTSIPAGATSFDYQWQPPADTFFRYIPSQIGVYNYECTPHVSFGMVGSITVTDPSVSTTEIVKDDFVLYPNPVKNNLRIEHPSQIEINVYDQYGCFKEHIITNKTISTSHWIPGVYYIKIEGTEPRLFKIIKL